MKRFLRLFALPAGFLGLALAAKAQAPVTQDPVLAEVHSLKRLVELQTKEINGLAEQVARLRQQLDGHEGHEGAGTPVPEVSSHPAGAPESTPAVSAPETPGPASAPEAPRAEATGGGIKHIVAKGETLTSIAKHYNVPLTELQTANKGLEARKMQIGQVLNIPAPTAPPAPATPAPTH